MVIFSHTMVIFHRFHGRFMHPVGHSEGSRRACGRAATRVMRTRRKRHRCGDMGYFGIPWDSGTQWVDFMWLPSGYVKIAIENGDFPLLR
jgi:hypothetical protein